MYLALRIIFSFLTAYKDMLILDDIYLNYSDMFMSKNETPQETNCPPEKNLSTLHGEPSLLPLLFPLYSVSS